MITAGQNVAQFVTKACGGSAMPDASFAIGYLNSKQHLIGGVLFDHYNGATIEIHIAGKPGWLTRKLIYSVFDYAFDRANANKIIGRVSSANTKSLKLALRFGFCHEATIKAGMPDGDLLLVTLAREQCRWL